MSTPKTLVQPYLMFNGRCDEAIEFYRSALGAEVRMLMRFKDSPDPCSEAAGDKVMHASLTIGDAVIMLSDGRCSGTLNFDGFALSLSVATDADVDKYFNALAEGGQVRMPLAKTFFASRFGMVADKFGVGWMIIAHPISG